MKQPNVPMNHAITTNNQKVDKEKFDSGWDRIWGKKEKLTPGDIEMLRLANKPEPNIDL